MGHVEGSGVIARRTLTAAVPIERDELFLFNSTILDSPPLMTDVRGMKELCRFVFALLSPLFYSRDV